MLGHMIDTTSVIKWFDVLSNRLINHSPYTIEVSMLKVMGAVDDIKIYPHELQGTLVDYITWLTAKDPERLKEDWDHLKDEQTQTLSDALGTMM